MEKQRARNPEEKAYRKQSIVSALRTLLTRSLYSLPSANEIAREAGFSKGVIYFYFDSREEIFLTLHIQEVALFFEGFNQILTAPDYSHERIRDYSVAYFSENSVFVYVGLLTPSIMEKNIGVPLAREFKMTIFQELDRAATLWTQAEPGLDLNSARKLLMRFYSLALMIWQRHHPPEVIQKAFAGSDLWLVFGDLKEELSECFDWLWLGMMQSQPR